MIISYSVVGVQSLLHRIDPSVYTRQPPVHEIDTLVDVDVVFSVPDTLLFQPGEPS